jgi:hypothetical protein
LAVGEGHVGEEHAEVGLVDAKLPLDRAGSEPDLASHQARATLEAALGVDVLHGIGIVRRHAGKAIAQRRDGLAARGRVPQLVRGRFDLAIVH